MKSISKVLSLESASLILDAEAWDAFMNSRFEIWYNEKTDTYALTNNYVNAVVYAQSLTVKELNERLKSFNPFWVKSDKGTYMGIVEYTLESMFELAQNDPSYCIMLDLIHYFRTTILTEGKITADEFWNLVSNIVLKHKRGE